MMKKLTVSILVLALGFVLSSCDSRTDQAEGGGVILSIESFDPIPTGSSAFRLVSPALDENGEVVTSFDCPSDINIVGFDGYHIGRTTIRNVVRNPALGTSNLLDVEMDRIEFRFDRIDGGTIDPPPMIRRIPGTVPQDGTFDICLLAFLEEEQIYNRPMSDMLAENGGIDRETGEPRQKYDVIAKVYGKTLSGDNVESAPVAFTFDLTQ